MEEAYGNLNAAYLQIKGMVVIEGFYALVAGFVITTFVFKLVGIIKEMINEGKGFNA
ncbi:putative transmembrane domain protein, partial [Bacteroides fragilis str. 3719 A10]